MLCLLLSLFRWKGRDKQLGTCDVVMWCGVCVYECVEWVSGSISTVHNHSLSLSPLSFPASLILRPVSSPLLFLPYLPLLPILFPSLSTIQPAILYPFSTHLRKKRNSKEDKCPNRSTIPSRTHPLLTLLLSASQSHRVKNERNRRMGTRRWTSRTPFISSFFGWER